MEKNSPIYQKISTQKVTWAQPSITCRLMKSPKSVVSHICIAIYLCSHTMFSTIVLLTHMTINPHNCGHKTYMTSSIISSSILLTPLLASPSLPLCFFIFSCYCRLIIYSSLSMLVIYFIHLLNTFYHCHTSPKDLKTLYSKYALCHAPTKNLGKSKRDESLKYLFDTISCSFCRFHNSHIGS